MFTLAQWKEYTEHVADTNSAILLKWQEHEEEAKKRWKEIEEQNKETYKKLTGSDSYFSWVRPMTFPVLEKATVEGCLTWLLTKK